jgi:hypothetical protein
LAASKNAIEAGVVTFAIKADFVPNDLSFVEWAERQLGLGITALDAVRAASSRVQVLVIVDQLDALASTVDLRSDRLNAVIDFISQCVVLPRVSVICSCRKFDFEHDTRFEALEADCLELELPAWELVVPQLVRHGVTDTESWPTAFREVLRTPQHLKVFLDRVTSTGAADTFTNYYSMLDDWWSRSRLTPDENVCLERLTQELIDNELIWAPVVRLECNVDVIGSLEAKGIVVSEGGRIGFRHQTVLEYAKARFFTKHGESLAKYVLERQSAVMVRPTVWAVLTYLRAVDQQKYRRELEELLEADLRLHLRYLLIEFLGQVAHPEDFEIALLAARLADREDTVRTLIAIRGNQAWFSALHRSHLPSVMRGPMNGQWPMVGVLADAFAGFRDECLNLIESNWLPSSQNDHFTWRALLNLEQWDVRSVEMVCRLVQRATGEGWHWAESLVSTISMDKPRLAPRVFREIVRARMGEGESTESQRFTSPLESTRGWYELPAVATAAPLEFLTESWEWLVYICNRFHRGDRGSVLYRYTGMCFALDEHERRPDSPVLTAFLSAIQALATSDPDRFVATTKPSWSSESAVLHRLVVRGLSVVVRSRPALGLEYLGGDRRRLFLGSMDSNEQSDSQAFITALAPALGEDGLQTLVQLILASSEYRDGVELEPEQKEWDREARLRLLTAIPAELHSEPMTSFIESEKRTLPHWDLERRISRSGWIREVPPISRETLLTSGDDEVVAAITASRKGERSRREMKEVAGGWEEPGGPYSAGKVIAELAKENPRRAIDLTLLLAHNCEHEAVEAAMTGLSDASVADDDVIRFMHTLDTVGPLTEELRSKGGNILYERCRSNSGLPDATCSMLRRWLSQPWDASYGIVAQDEANAVAAIPDHVSSVLWSPRHGILDTDRSFWPLLAVTYGYLSRPKADTEQWLDTVAEHLQSTVAERTWGAYCAEMRWITLNGCDMSRGEEVLKQLFRRFPRLITQIEGIRLLANTSFRLTAAFVQECLNTLRASESYLARQGFGELLTVVALRDRNHGWAPTWLDAELRAIEDNKDHNEATTIGIAFAASNFWDESQARLHAARIICRLLPYANNRVGQAIATVFWASDDLEADEGADLLLTALSNSPAVLAEIPVLDLSEHLSALMPHRRALVLRVCNAIVRSGRKETDLFEAGPHLVKIAMTLQRFSDTREGGLSLLESLLRLGLDDAFRLLREIDIRPADTVRREPRRRRRRRSQNG